MTTREGMMKAAEICERVGERFNPRGPYASIIAAEIRHAAAELPDVTREPTFNSNGAAQMTDEKTDALVAFLRGLANRAGARAAQFYSYPHGLELEAEQRKLNEAAARIEALEKALRPFADAAKAAERKDELRAERASELGRTARPSDDGETVFASLGDCRAARATLEGKV